MNKTPNLKNLTEHPFWKFSVKIFAIPTVQNALLKLQNERTLNVNMILFCCWHAFRGQGRLVKTELASLLQTIHLWHEWIVLPLRRLRQTIKGSEKNWATSIYKEVLDSELLAEQCEQHMLAEVLLFQTKPIRTTFQKITDTCKNIVAYSNKMQITLKLSDHLEIAEIIAAIFPQIESSSIVQCCQQILTGNEQAGNVASQLPLDLIGINDDEG